MQTRTMGTFSICSMTPSPSFFLLGLQGLRVRLMPLVRALQGDALRKGGTWAVPTQDCVAALDQAGNRVRGARHANTQA